MPHSFNDESEVCLFTKLPGKQVKEKLKEQGITNVTKASAVLKIPLMYTLFGAMFIRIEAKRVFLLMIS